MAKVYRLPLPNQPTAHFSREKGGYILVAPEIIGRFFEYMRGIGPDAFIIKKYTKREDGVVVGSEIMRGCVPTEAYNRTIIRQKQRQLEAELDARAIEAFDAIRGRIARNYQIRNHGNDVVFVKTNDGIVGCGWYDSAHTIKKGLKMAAFMLYALGILNAKNDNDLFRAVYNYLPYDSELTSTEAEKASAIIMGYLGDKIVGNSD